MREGGGTVVWWCVGKERIKYDVLLLLRGRGWCRKEFETVLSEDVKCAYSLIYCCYGLLLHVHLVGR